MTQKLGAPLQKSPALSGRVLNNKVAGLLSLPGSQYFLKTLRDYFGARKLRLITRGGLGETSDWV
jgi:hypothetical protein